MREGQTYAVEELPGVLPSYLKALRSRPGFRDGDLIPATRVEWPAFRIDQESVAIYSRACRWPILGGQVPLFFPHSYFGPLHLLMLTDEHFPLRVLGALHQRNHILQHKPMFPGDLLSASLYFSAQRRRPQGLEVDLRTEIRADGELSWESVTTFLFRTRLAVADPESALAGTAPALERAEPLASFPVPRNTGRTFARITRDINPIHVSRLLARGFGFERDLAHGMWAMCRSQSLVKGLDYWQPLRSDVAFKGPLYIGRDVTFKAAGGDRSHYELYSGDNPRPCVVAKLRNLEPGTPLEPAGPG